MLFRRTLRVLLSQRVLQLLVLDPAARVVVDRVEQCVDLLARRLKAQRRHRLPQLLLVERAVAVVIPLAEQIDQLHVVRLQRVVQLLLHRQLARRLQAHQRRQRLRAHRVVVGVEVLVRARRCAPLVCLPWPALQLALRRLRARALAQHHIQLLVLELTGPIRVERVEDRLRVRTIHLEP